jgi:hypothetical protein
MRSEAHSNWLVVVTLLKIGVYCLGFAIVVTLVFYSYVILQFTDSFSTSLLS